MEALNKDSLVWQKEYRTESFSKSRENGAKCGGVILFGLEPNGSPLEKMGKTNAGVDDSLQKSELDQGAR
ncbi:hypothetical protein Taro_040284 [Colocasia esculenta]|uniref:Uncharacterized protein n=1 Tax=Colocasia esculenta TaxID=4460 RepID=A0A843WLE6_COLES|nr:hypothetical protein [Colocasia esculenta]